MASIIKIKRRSANPSNFDISKNYTAGTKVVFEGSIYVAIQNNIGSQPDVSPLDWSVTADTIATSGAPSSLHAGELAFDELDNKLYYGSSVNDGSVILIGSASSALLSGIHYGDGSRLTNISATSPFDQTLNIASNVQFNQVETKKITGGNYGANQLIMPLGFGPMLAGLAEGNVSIITGNSDPDHYLNWKFNHSDRSFTLPPSGVLQAANGSNLYIGSNLIPTTSAFYIGDINNPVNRIYLAASTLHLASTTTGISGLALSNINNTFTILSGGLRSTEIYTGGLLISGNNIGADPTSGPLPMTIGTNGLQAVQILVPMTVNSSVSAWSLSGSHYGDGSHLTDVFNQSLNSTNNVTFSSLNVTTGLTAHNTVIIGDLSATGKIYASDVHAPFSVNNYTSSLTLSLSDVDGLITINSTSSTILGVPNNNLVPFDIGSRIKLAQLGTAQITVSAGAGVTVHSPTGYAKTAQRYSMADLYKIATNTWLLEGDLSKN